MSIGDIVLFPPAFFDLLRLRGDLRHDCLPRNVNDLYGPRNDLIDHDTIATGLTQPAPAPLILTGKQQTVNP
jgi:hypothetical protein